MRTILFGLFFFMAWHANEWSRRTDEMDRRVPNDRERVAATPAAEQLTTMDGGSGFPPR